MLMKDFAISQASGADFNFDPETVSRIMGFLLVCLVLMLVLMLIVHGYYIYFECTSGQTPGKKILGLRVVDLHGGKITKAQALTREMFRWYLDALLVPLTLISIYSTVRRQRVGDIVAKTLVVEIEKTPSNTTTF